MLLSNRTSNQRSMLSWATGRIAVKAASITALAALMTVSAGVAANANRAVFTVLHNFSDGSVTNDGQGPQAALTVGVDGNFYGTTDSGGAGGVGTVFKATPGGAITILHAFGDGHVANDGDSPDAPVIQTPNHNFYGTTFAGGTAGMGTVYMMTPAGAVTILHSFGDGSVTNDGIQPSAALLYASDGNFYGTTEAGGSAHDGVVFKMTPSGVVTILHSFGDGSVTHDGAIPLCALIQSGGLLYGTTSSGGVNGNGTVFSMNLTGTETLLHVFANGSVANDGSAPAAGLVIGKDGAFYGTTFQGGDAGNGTIFKVTSTGTYTLLHNFDDGGVIDDGDFPQTQLFLNSDGNFYGTCTQGGAGGNGTVFKMSPTGTVATLHSFGDGSVAKDGNDPEGSLVQGPGGALFGTTSAGGTTIVSPNPGYGIMFEVTRPTKPVRFDFNGDGKDDLLWENSSTGQLLVWDMNGTTAKTYNPPFSSIGSGSAWHVAAVGDVNGDGHPDLLWQNSSTHQLLFWLMNGTNVTSYGSPFATLPANWQVVSLADFDGDGSPDILLENTVTGACLVWYLNGTSIKQYAPAFTTVPNTNYSILGTGYFSGDGTLDLLWTNKSNGQLLLWDLGGAGGTTVQSYGQPFTEETDLNWSVASTGDTNGDGHPDLVWRNKVSGQVLVWEMGGSTGTTVLNYGSPFATQSDLQWNIVGVH